MCVEREGLVMYLFWISVLGGDTNVHVARWCKRVIFRMLILNLCGRDCTEIATLSHWVLLWNQEEEGLKQGLRLWPAQWPDRSLSEGFVFNTFLFLFKLYTQRITRIFLKLNSTLSILVVGKNSITWNLTS